MLLKVLIPVLLGANNWLGFYDLIANTYVSFIYGPAMLILKKRSTFDYLVRLIFLYFFEQTLAIVYIQQTYQHLLVFNATLSLHFDCMPIFIVQ